MFMTYLTFDEFVHLKKNLLNLSQVYTLQSL